MTGESKRLVDVPTVNSIFNTDTVFVTSGGAVSQAPPASLYSNINFQVATVLVGNNYTPSNSTINVAQGTLWFDSTYLYVAIANNVLKRLTLSSF